MTFIYVYFRWGLESQIVDIRYLILILTRELVSDVVERHRVVDTESRGTVKQKMQEQHGGGGGTPPHPGHKLPTVIHRSTQLSMKAIAGPLWRGQYSGRGHTLQGVAGTCHCCSQKLQVVHGHPG